MREAGDHPYPRRKRVLIADSDETARMALASKLSSVDGLVVDVVANGRDALDVARSRKPDAIVMNMRMPVMDGYQATHAIRSSRNGLKKVPIIALTDACMSGEIQRCIRAGASDYIARPRAEADDLRRKVLFWVGLGRDEFGTGLSLR